MAERQRSERVHYVSVTDNAPLKERRISAPARLPTFSRDVLGATVLVFSLALGASYMAARLMGQALVLVWPGFYAEEGASWEAALFVACALGLATAYQRLQIWDQELLPKLREDQVYQEIEVRREEPADYRITRMVRGGDDLEVPLLRRQVRLGHGGQSLSLSGRQLDTIQAWHEAGHTSIRRNSNHLGPGFDVIGLGSGEAYGQARAILIGLGYVSEANEWTEEGRAWASSAGLPEGHG